MKGGVLEDTIENDGTTLSIAGSEIQASSLSFNLAGAQLGSVGSTLQVRPSASMAAAAANTIINDPNGQSTHTPISTLHL
jgi:hypothetical protein